MSATAMPTWLYPPEGRAWTVDDLDRLPPEAPRRLEIIDGALIVMSPQNAFHMLALRALEHGLVAQVPNGLMVAREWTMMLPDGDAPEPDILVLDHGCLSGAGQTRVDAEHVRLVIEVVSPDSRKRDVFRKPQLYANAGIDYYWIVDREADATVVRTYHRDPTGGYQPAGEHRDRISCTMPFPIDLDLSTEVLGL